MPRGKRGKPPEEKLTNATTVVEFRPPAPKPNGSEPPIPPLKDLEPAEALRILTEVSALNDRALDAFKAYSKSREETKDLKTKWEQLSEQVQSRLKELTHPADLPLFDQRQAEADVAAATTNTITDEEAPASTLTEGVTEGEQAPAPPNPVAPEDAPF